MRSQILEFIFPIVLFAFLGLELWQYFPPATLKLMQWLLTCFTDVHLINVIIMGTVTSSLLSLAGIAALRTSTSKAVFLAVRALNFGGPALAALCIG